MKVLRYRLLRCRTECIIMLWSTCRYSSYIHSKKCSVKSTEIWLSNYTYRFFAVYFQTGKVSQWRSQRGALGTRAPPLDRAVHASRST